MGLRPGLVPTLWSNQSTSPLVATATITTPPPLGRLTIRWWPSRSHHLPRPLSYGGVFRSRTWVSPSCRWWEGYLPRLLFNQQLSSEREFTNFHLYVYMYNIWRFMQYSHLHVFIHVPRFSCYLRYQYLNFLKIVFLVPQSNSVYLTCYMYMYLMYYVCVYMYL